MQSKASTTRIATAVALCFLLAIMSVVTFARHISSETEDSDDTVDSPRLAALARELATGDAAANRLSIDAFLKELQGKGPLIEPTSDDPHSSWITFLWRGDANTRRMNVQGGPATGDFAPRMMRLQNTNLWYRTDRIPNDARFTYFFQVNRPLKFPPHSERLPPLAPPRADPLNPRTLSNPERSLVELPEAPPQPWIQRLTGVPEGITHAHSITSEVLAIARPPLELRRKFWVRTPNGFDPNGEPAGLLVLFDGSPNVDAAMPIPVIVDNLIAQKSIPPLVTVFVHQTKERDREVGCSEAFSDFIAKELVPWMRKNYNVSSEPRQAIVGGMSGGGLMAAFCGFRHSDVFGNVLSLSGGIGWWAGSLEEKLDEEPGWLTRQFVSAPRVPVRFFLSAGRFENYFFPYNLLVENRRFRDVLLAKGHSVQYSEFSGRHDPVCWRGPFVDGLIWLTGAPHKE